MRKLIYIICLSLLLLAAGCSAQDSAAGTASDAEIAAASPAETVPDDASDEPAQDGPAALNLTAPALTPAGVSYAGGVYTVTAAGVYTVTGELSGRLLVDADGPVELILAGVSLTGPECMELRTPVTLTLAAGSVNAVSDGAEEPDEFAEAAILAKDRLVIGGDGALTVAGGARNGIQSKGDLLISGGDLIVTAAHHGLKARGALSVTGGSVTVSAGADGLAAESSRLAAGDVSVTGGSVTIEAGARGLDCEGAAVLAAEALTVVSGDDAIRADTVEIAGGRYSLTAGRDGVQAATALTVSGGTLAITAGTGGGGAINKAGDNFGPFGGQTSSTSSESAKGLKSDGEISILGGQIDLNTEDDAIHAGTLCTIGGGEITIYTGDDAIHSDDMLVIRDGSVNITDCFEGLEAYAVEVRGGTVNIRAVNDGINANGPEMGWGRQTAEVTSISGYSICYYYQAGGSVDIVVTGNWNNVGDGVDSNGGVLISGGVLTVSTQGDTQEGGIDTGYGGPVVTGGMVMAGGASMMQENWSSSSTQCCAVVSVSTQPAGLDVSILDEDGEEIWTVTMANRFSCLVLSHPALEEGHVYTLRYGDTEQTLDFTETTVIRSSRGGFGFPGPF